MSGKSALLSESCTDSPSRQATIKVFNETGLVITHTLQLGKTSVFGRHSSADIRVKSSRVSRRHATFSLTRAGLCVTDRKSANGVLIQGVPIAPGFPVLIRPEQSIRICKYTVRFRLTGFGERSEHATRDFVARLAEYGEELEVMGQLGSGTDGSVWAAIDKANKRKVALKLLHVSIVQTEENLERFFREADVCKRIASPHVVKVYDIRIVDGQPIIAMELVDGPTALERLRDRRAPLPLREALSIGVDIAKALVATAEAGVVHRDVKPSNVLLSPDGAKLSDFGIAKAVDRPSITEIGVGMGTLVYVAPEQALSATDADARADIYGLGASLYHLLTGNPPYDSRKPARDLFIEILSDTLPTSMLSYRLDLPMSLVEVVEHMLQRDPARRPQSAQRVVADLQAILDMLPASDANAEDTLAD